MQLWEIWKELSFAYTKTCFEFTAAGMNKSEHNLYIASACWGRSSLCWSRVYGFMADNGQREWKPHDEMRQTYPRLEWSDILCP